MISPDVETQAEHLKSRWSDNWLMLNDTKGDISTLTEKIDQVRFEVKQEISTFQ